MSQKDVVRKELKSRLNQWQGQIEEIETRIRQSKEARRDIGMKDIENLRKELRRIHEHAEKLETADEKTWDAWKRAYDDYTLRITRSIEEVGWQYH